MSVIQTDTLDTIQEKLKAASRESLIIFDINEVLIMPNNDFRLTHPYRRALVADLQKRLTYEERKILFSILLSCQEFRLLDPNILNVISELKIRQIPVIALTKSFTGKLGNIESCAELMLNVLKNFNISFSDSSPFKEDISINELETQDGIPVLKEGVLLTTKVDKGSVLEWLLKKNNYYPKEIIFIDNDLENLESVQKICKKYNIDFQGFEYTEAKNIPEIELDELEEKKRFKILEKQHIWKLGSI